MTSLAKSAGPFYSERAVGDSGPILVVDDDEEVVALLVRLLEHDGRHVRGATGPKEALAIAELEPPALVLTDLMMPYMDGESFLAALGARLRERMPPVVIISASIERRDAGRRLGAAAVIEKPFDPDDVRDVVARLLDAPA